VAYSQRILWGGGNDLELHEDKCTSNYSGGLACSIGNFMGLALRSDPYFRPLASFVTLASLPWPLQNLHVESWQPAARNAKPYKGRTLAARAGFRGRGLGVHTSHQLWASHQTVSVLFLATDRCLRISCRTFLIIVLVRPDLSWSPGLPPAKSDPSTVCFYIAPSSVCPCT